MVEGSDCDCETTLWSLGFLIVDEIGFIVLGQVLVETVSCLPLFPLRSGRKKRLEDSFC